MAGSIGKSKTYTLQVGRRGKEAWLSVEGIGNVSGQAVGTMTQLDVSPVLYIGMLSQRATLNDIWHKVSIWTLPLSHILRLSVAIPFSSFISVINPRQVTLFLVYY